MTLEIDQLAVLKDFTSRLEKLGIPYMLTGSMALVHYAMPRTTVDIDIVIDLPESKLEEFFRELENDYYIPLNSARRAVRSSRVFNVINSESIVKVDCVILKDGEYPAKAFSRRTNVSYTEEIDVWIISREDLILSKLQWALLGDSERQKRDIAGLVLSDYDNEYVKDWAQKLGVAGLFNEIAEGAGSDDP